MNKIGLFLGLILSAAGMYRIDKFLIPTLDYFGKYVFFAAVNFFAFWVVWVFYRKFDGYMKIAMPSVFGLVILLIGVRFA